MKYLDYHEKRTHGTLEFPIAFYHLPPTHPRYEMPYHWHKEYELIKVLEGSFTIYVDDRTLLLTAGDIVLLQDGVLHGGTPVDCVYDCIVFNIDFLTVDNHLYKKKIDDFLSHRIQLHQKLPQEDPFLQALMDQLFNHMSSKPLGYELFAKGNLLQLLGLIINKGWYTESPNEHIKVSHQISPLKKVLKKIETDYSETISLEELAKEAGMNARYFCRYFKKLTQKSPIDYLNYYRVECACEQLLSTPASITEIALNCGFSESGYFIRTFKKYKGTTPKRYRTQKWSN